MCARHPPRLISDLKPSSAPKLASTHPHDRWKADSLTKQPLTGRVLTLRNESVIWADNVAQHQTANASLPRLAPRQKRNERESRHFTCLHQRRHEAPFPSAFCTLCCHVSSRTPADLERSCIDMADRSPRQPECYADDMTDMSRWELSQRHYDANWGYQHPEAPVSPLPFAFADQAGLTESLGQLQLGRVPKTRTSPVVTRTRIARHGSQPNPVRPSSSGGENVMLPYRHFGPPRRAESYSHPTPLEDFRRSRRWPPNGYRKDDALSPEEADELICAGASTFKGYWDEIPNTPPGYNRFYAVMQSEHQSRTDRAPIQQAAYRGVSLNMTGASDSQFPWLSLEQPCMAYAFGKSAGTTTLNYWVSKSSNREPPIKLAGDAKPRKLKFLQILDRLQQLENGLEEDVSPSFRPAVSLVHAT